jgi:hypothetical protein
MSTESDFSRKFSLRKSGTKANGILVFWLTIAGHFEETFRRQNIAESDPLFVMYMLSVLL